jgi:hypothetical protein
MQLRRMRGVDVKRDEPDADGTTTRGAGARKERTARPAELLRRPECMCMWNWAARAGVAWRTATTRPTTTQTPERGSAQHPLDKKREVRMWSAGRER